jgi:hypothetical protein
VYLCISSVKIVFTYTIYFNWVRIRPELTLRQYASGMKGQGSTTKKPAKRHTKNPKNVGKPN